MLSVTASNPKVVDEETCHSNQTPPPPSLHPELTAYALRSLTPLQPPRVRLLFRGTALWEIKPYFNLFFSFFFSNLCLVSHWQSESVLPQDSNLRGVVVPKLSFLQLIFRFFWSSRLKESFLEVCCPSLWPCSWVVFVPSDDRESINLQFLLNIMFQWKLHWVKLWISVTAHNFSSQHYSHFHLLQVQPAVTSSPLCHKFK